MIRENRTRSGNPVSEVFVRDKPEGVILEHYYELRLGRFIRFRFHDSRKVELVVGKYVNSLTLTLRRGREVMTRLAVVAVLLLMPSLAAAQKHPGAEMLKGFPEQVYQAAQKAYDVAVKEDKDFRENLVKLERAGANLRQAIAEETNLGKFAETYGLYILASTEIATAGVDVMVSNSEVVEAYFKSVDEKRSGHYVFMRWMKEAGAHADTFTYEFNDRRLIQEARAKYKKLSGGN
jgi:hypothetical protein